MKKPYSYPNLTRLTEGDWGELSQEAREAIDEILSLRSLIVSQNNPDQLVAMNASLTRSHNQYLIYSSRLEDLLKRAIGLLDEDDPEVIQITRDAQKIGVWL